MTSALTRICSRRLLFLFLVGGLLVCGKAKAQNYENFDSVFYSSSCVNSLITFGSTVFDSLPFPSYILWNFGYPAAGLYNTAAVQSPTFTYPVAGTYYLSLTVVNSGTTDTVRLYDTLTISTPLTYNFGPDIYLCQGQDTLIQGPVVAGAKYFWNNQPLPADTLDTLRVITSGVYSVSINGCWVTDSIGVFISDSPRIDLGQNHVMCDSANLTLDASSQNGIYTWTLNGALIPGAGGQLLTHSPGGYYHINVVVPGCGIYNDSVTITYSAPQAPPFSIGVDTTLCPSEIDTVNASIPGATAFIWSTGSTDSVIYITQSGTYWAFVTYNNQCQVTDTLLVSYLQPPLMDFDDTAICQGGFLILNADFGQGTYSWTASPPQRDDQNQSGQATYDVYNPGTFTVVAQIGQCTFKDSIKVTFDDSLKVYLPKDTSACNGADFRLTLKGNPDSVIWQDGTLGFSHTIPQPGGTYTAIAKNGCGADTLTSVVSFGECACNLIMPNAFTPNGDGHNDLFLPLNYCKMSYYRLEVFDRYGVLVFKTEDPNAGWDGNYVGKPALDGNYVWMVKYVNDGETAPVIKKGNILIVR
jgi:gliding motility-associated-like protein